MSFSLSHASHMSHVPLLPRVTLAKFFHVYRSEIKLPSETNYS